MIGEPLSVEGGYPSLPETTSGPLAQLARALASHARGHKFKSCTVHVVPQP